MKEAASDFLNKFQPPFRVGRKQKRAILDDNGHEVGIFTTGLEQEAQRYCDYLNQTYNSRALMERGKEQLSKLDKFIEENPNFLKEWMEKEGILVNETKPDYKTYDEVLPVFMKYMRKELAANYTKGDRNGENGWLNITKNKFWLGELYYHVGKLQAAMREEDTELIKELTADVANIAMMILDVKINLLSPIEKDNEKI